MRHSFCFTHIGLIYDQDNTVLKQLFTKWCICAVNRWHQHSDCIGAASQTNQTTHGNTLLLIQIAHNFPYVTSLRVLIHTVYETMQRGERSL